MKNEVIIQEFEIHTTPSEKILIDAYTIEISIDDINEKRYKIIAKPYQALRVTTTDCISYEKYYNEFCYRDGRFHRHILQIIDSPMIRDLKANLTDESANFLNNVKHYVLPLQDIVIEFVATELIICEE
jgi:hypothetical protein